MPWKFVFGAGRPPGGALQSCGPFVEAPPSGTNAAFTVVVRLPEWKIAA